jgi:transcriptional regulator with XRE-family HTH domain
VAKGIHDARYQQVIEALKAARIARRLSQTAVADRLGKRQQFVSKYESGERRLDMVEFLDVAKILEVDWGALLKGVD